jgi:hypothetical protein
MECVVKLFIALAGVILILAASFPAMAQGARGSHRAGPGGPGRPVPQQVPVRSAGLQNPDGRGGRLTPQERQQLKRDVNDHGRDIYRDRSGASRP